jgi:hypothetical protein
MAQDKDERPIGLSPAQVAGSALAAVSGALLASFAGTTGTIIGTAVGSVVATVGAAIYTWSLRRTSAAVRRTAAQVRHTALLTGQLPRTVAQGPLRSRNGAASPTRAERDAADRDAEDMEADEADASVRSVPWGKVALASVGMTVVVLGGITTFEAVTGHPLSSLVGGDDSTGTTLGDSFGTGEKKAPEHKKPTHKTTPSDDASQAPGPGGDTNQTPDVPDTSVVPDPQPSVAPDPSTPSSAVPEGGPTANPSAQP